MGDSRGWGDGATLPHGPLRQAAVRATRAQEMLMFTPAPGCRAVRTPRDTGSGTAVAAGRPRSVPPPTVETSDEGQTRGRPAARRKPTVPSRTGPRKGDRHDRRR